MTDHAAAIFQGIQPVTLLSSGKFSFLYGCLQAVRDLDGDIAELGVYKGGISAAMALIAPEKVLHLFDTFEGMREPTFAEPHGKGDFADTSEEGVRDLFDPERPPHFHRGWFPETVTDELRQRRFCFVHVDGDFYETTRDAIDFFWPRLVSRGIMVFDDWEWVSCPGVKRALQEAAQSLGFPIQTSGEMQAYIQKF